MQRLVLLYDAQCPMCTRFRDWLVRQPHGTPLESVPVASPQARALFPALDHEATRREVTVVADTGEVWTGPSAWVMCLWATREHRDLALRLASPLGLPVAKAMAYAAAGLRASLTRSTSAADGASVASGAADGSSVASGAAGGSSRSTDHPPGGGYPDDCDGLCQPV